MAACRCQKGGYRNCQHWVRTAPRMMWLAGSAETGLSHPFRLASPRESEQLARGRHWLRRLQLGLVKTQGLDCTRGLVSQLEMVLLASAPGMGHLAGILCYGNALHR